MRSLSASAEALFLGPDHVVALALNAMLLLFQALSCSRGTHKGRTVFTTGRGGLAGVLTGVLTEQLSGGRF